MGEVYKFKQNKEERTQSYRARFKEDPVMRAMMQTKLKNKLDRKRAKADEILWRIDGEDYDRYKMMDLLVHLVSEGYSLVEICEDQTFPTLEEVRGWCPNHPAFERDLAGAEKIRGEIYGEMQVQIAMNTTGHTVAADKLKCEILGKAAARLNSKYQDKQIVQTEDMTSRMTEEQIRERLVAMMDANPELAEVIMPTLGQKKGAEAPSNLDVTETTSHPAGE